MRQVAAPPVLHCEPCDLAGAAGIYARDAKVDVHVASGVLEELQDRIGR
jgi:hypothetical protein